MFYFDICSKYIWCIWQTVVFALRTVYLSRPTQIQRPITHPWCAKKAQMNYVMKGIAMARAESGLPEQISEKIIQLSLDKHLEQGDRLPKVAVLVERLGTGRSTVREAIKLLQSRNIVRIKQGSGTYVASNPGVADNPLGLLLSAISNA